MNFLRRINPRFFFLTLLIPAGLVGFGFFVILLLVIMPYLNLKVSSVMETPVVPDGVRSASGFGKFKFSELPKTRDFSVRDVPATFSLSIPKLKIQDAKVETNSANLDPKNFLGHYRGTALPGETGNAFIYGHSVLPIFFNPKDYKTIFSTLPRLEKGDRFFIGFSSRELKYEVVEKIVLAPDDVNVYDPDPARLGPGNSTVTLMTCVPPGSKTYRILVVGKLVS